MVLAHNSSCPVAHVPCPGPLAATCCLQPPWSCCNSWLHQPCWPAWMAHKSQLLQRPPRAGPGGGGSRPRSERRAGPAADGSPSPHHALGSYTLLMPLLHPCLSRYTRFFRYHEDVADGLGPALPPAAPHAPNAPPATPTAARTPTPPPSACLPPVVTIALALISHGHLSCSPPGGSPGQQHWTCHCCTAGYL